MQFAEAAHIALAPRRHAVTQPMLLALDRLTKFVLFQLFRLKHLIAPRFEMRKATVEPPRRAAVEPDGRGRDLFEETTVVGN